MTDNKMARGDHILDIVYIRVENCSACGICLRHASLLKITIKLILAQRKIYIWGILQMCFPESACLICPMCVNLKEPHTIFIPKLKSRVQFYQDMWSRFVLFLFWCIYDLCNTAHDLITLLARCQWSNREWLIRANSMNIQLPMV